MLENISAISTAKGVGGVAIIRISGDSPLEIAEKMFIPQNKKISVKNFEPYKLYTGEILCNGFTDFGMCVYFKAPKSYTGEEMVEFHCHGGIAVTEGVLKKTFELGARPATNGEFTKRAFMNGKLSLSSCEGLIDMINSESVREVKAGYYLYRERLNAKITAMQDKLTYALAEIDANIDYPEEGLEGFATEKTKEALYDTLEELKVLIDSYQSGKKIKSGVKVALCGKPNTGKSSLLNALLGYDKAIVSDEKGTTRDVVEGCIEIKGIKFNLFDTAGIHESSSSVENIGIDRANKIIAESDVVIFVTDASEELNEEDYGVYEKIKNTNLIVVRNKTDKEVKQEEIKADVTVSSKTGKGLFELKELLYEKGIGSGEFAEENYLVEERHEIALKKAYASFKKAYDGIGKIALDLIALDIKSGWDNLGEISGLTASEKIIDEIFSKFCVGK